MLFTILNDQMSACTCLIKAGHLSETLDSVCVCKNMNILFSLLLLKFKLRPTKGLRLTRGRTFVPPSRGYFRTLRHKAACVAFVHVCVLSEVYYKDSERQKGSGSLFSLEARGSGWFWGCASELSWCFSPSCWTAQQGAGTEKDPTLFCGGQIVAKCWLGPTAMWDVVIIKPCKSQR